MTALSVERRRPGTYIATLRLLLRFINLLLAAGGLAMVCYACYMYWLFANNQFPEGAEPHHKKLGFPWFVFAFGGAGAVTFLTAATGLAAVACNSRALLGLYSVLMVLLLLAQAAVAVAFFADESWRRHLPPDATGEAEWMTRVIEENVVVCRWVGLAVLLVQVACMGLAYALSSAQQRLLLDASMDEEDEVWGRRRPLLPQSAANGRAPHGASGTSPSRTDAWSARMRDKYGLDTSQFGYNRAAAEAGTPPPPPLIPREDVGAARRRCAIM
ncbi:hypothetical protein WJX81_008318 [Elliptochloris bilobata]|uniref:Tetraspanin-19 n=1 Tax=Elliptochloris bilobata TaxID=381761 RepID=A0AAW1QLT4_9CHLO